MDRSMFPAATTDEGGKMEIKHHLKTVLETQETGKAPTSFKVTETEFMELLWRTPLFC